MARKVKPWVGKTDDSRPPPSARDRIFENANGICHVCTLTIEPTDKWDADHVIAIINGGKNEESNLKPAHWHCHKDKTKRDVAEKSKVAKVRQKHRGIKKETKAIPSKKSERAKDTDRNKRDVFAGLPRRSLFKPKGS